MSRSLSELANRINNTSEDIKAEVIVSNLLSSGIRRDDILIRFAGQLKRPRSSDIAEVKITQDSKGRDRVEIALNRDGIYDTLPEGLFHQPSADRKGHSVSTMVEEYHQQRREEKKARQFFAPFENELFLHKTTAESEAIQQLFQLKQWHLNSSILEMLGIDPALPRAFISKLLRLIPYLSQITGRLSRTEQIVTLLLGDPAAITVDSFTDYEASSHESLLGDTTLGAGLAAGNRIKPDHRSYRLTIGPVSRKELLRYKDGGWKEKALQILVNFVIPVEWDIAVQIHIHEEEAVSFILDKANQTNARLGYTTTLPQST